MTTVPRYHLILMALVIFVIGISVGIIATWDGPAQYPHCPTEDSCIADYRDGQWFIERDTP